MLAQKEQKDRIEELLNENAKLKTFLASFIAMTNNQKTDILAKSTEMEALKLKIKSSLEEISAVQTQYEVVQQKEKTLLKQIKKLKKSS